MQKNRNNNIGMLHLIGALFVMYGHHCAILGQAIPIFLGTQIQAIGVKSIFLISGYLITKSLWSIHSESRIRTTAIYCVKRIGRLYPEYIVCILLCAIIVGPLFTQLSWEQYWTNIDSIKFFIRGNLLLFPIFSLPGVFNTNIYPNAVNGSFWTMPVEVALYMLILLVFLISKNDKLKKNVYIIVSALVIVAFVIRFYLFPNEYCVWYGTDWLSALNIMPYFLIGGMAYLFEWNKYTNTYLASALVFIFGGSLAIAPVYISEILCMVVLSYFVLSLMLAPEQKLVLKGICGEYAYGMYLYGFVVQQCVSQLSFLDREVDFWNFHVSFIACVLVTYICAMISFKCVYRPVNKINKWLLDKIG